MRHHTAADVDAGLQPERTSMAWARTALACCIASAITVRWVPFYGVGVLIMPALTLIAAVAISLTQQHRISVAVSGIHDESLSLHPWPLLALVAVCWALGVSGVVLVLLQ